MDLRNQVNNKTHQNMPMYSQPYHTGMCDMTLAMAYFMMQPQIKNVYNPGEALKRGTLFPDLDKPFMERGGVK